MRGLSAYKQIFTAALLMTIFVLLTRSWFRERELATQLAQLEQRGMDLPRNPGARDPRSGQTRNSAGNEGSNSAYLEARVEALEVKMARLLTTRGGDSVAGSEVRPEKLTLAELDKNPEVREKIADIMEENRHERWRERVEHMKQMVDDEVYKYAEENGLDDAKSQQIVEVVQQLFDRQQEIHQQIRSSEVTFQEGREQMMDSHIEAKTRLIELVGDEGIEALGDVVPWLQGTGRGRRGPPL